MILINALYYIRSISWDLFKQCASILCLDCFQIWDIINNAVMNTHRHNRSLKTSIIIIIDNKSLEVALYGHRKWMSKIPVYLAKRGQILCFLSLFCFNRWKNKDSKGRVLFISQHLFQDPGVLVCQDLSIPSLSR